MVLPSEMERIGFLHDLGKPYADRLVAMAELKEYAAGAVIFRQRQDSKSIHLVLAGEVRLEVEVSGQEVVEIHRAQPGELLGWSPVLGRHSMTAIARAATPARLAVLDLEQIMAMCAHDPHFGAAFHRQVALLVSSRFDDTRRQLWQHVARRPTLGCAPEGSD